MTYAERSSHDFTLQVCRTSQANAFHQAGQRAKAEKLYCAAESAQAESQPDYPVLYSGQGHQYSDLLLSAPERLAWQRFLTPSETHLPCPTDACKVVIERAGQTLGWAIEQPASLITIALDHLTLGRAALYAAILGGSEFDSYQDHVQQAVDGLRRAGTAHHIPRGLFSRAWLRAQTGSQTGPESAQTDLDEAWEIAERGPMPLFLADIHLYRARLFYNVQPYPWSEDEDGNPRGPKDDLKAARRLIEKHGYWRRKEELEDAEAAALSW